MSPPRLPELAAVATKRTAGYAAVGDYAAIGDGRTLALVARDGAIDWLCLPNLDSPTVFAALLDAERGGRFALAPEEPYVVERRYLPDTNLLETTFSTAAGAVRVTDALTLTDAGLAPARELVRRIDGMAGSVALSWSVEPRFGYAKRTMRYGRRAGVAVASAGVDALAVCAWGAGDPAIAGGRIGARFSVAAGERALIALAAAHQEPLVLPGRLEVEARLDATGAFWRRWTGGRGYSGPWREAVLRSALALKLLVHAPSGAIAAAGTTSLPETIGGERNWDYRFCWIRDSAFTLAALLALGCEAEAEAFFWWLLQASQLTHPRLQVLYRLDGGSQARERELALDGYRGSQPVRVGNGAADQLQLDTYGDLFETAWLAHSRGVRLDPEAGRRLADMADLVCRVWREPDAGIWEVRSPPRHFTHSQMMCWVALDRACRLAAAGRIPGHGAQRWRSEAAAIRRFVEGRCWSDDKRSYLRAAGSEELDASILLAFQMGYSDPRDPRLRTTIDALQRELGRGPLLYRYSGEDGLAGGEGVFLACSFWLVDALARAGRTEQAGRTMEELLALANDVGLYAEEIDPDSGAFLGNFPQGLVHLALVNAAVSCAEAGL